MPLENITNSQNQRRLFEETLSKRLNSKNKLYKLRNLVNWSELEENALAHIDVKQFGRNKKPHRVMLGLLMLQAMYNGSDSFTEAELMENIYWQYFCGYEYILNEPEVSEASIRRFRKAIGENSYRPAGVARVTNHISTLYELSACYNLYSS